MLKALDETESKFKNPKEILNEILAICEREKLFCGTNGMGVPMTLNNILDAVKSIRSLPSDSDQKERAEINSKYYNY